MLRKMCTNVVFLCCMALLSAVGAVNCPPLAGAKGVESQGLALDPDRGVEPLSMPSTDQGGIDSYVKLLLHADGSDQGTAFTDSSSGAKTITNTETYDSYTKLMLHMEGSGNNFVDSAASKAVTTNGDVTQTTAQYKLGSESAVFDGSGDYLSLADSDNWNFGTGDFTIDFWVRFNSTNGGQDWICIYDDVDHYFRFRWSGTQIVMNLGAAAGQGVDGYWNWTPVADTWYHIALVRSVNSLNTYVNGVKLVDTANVKGWSWNNFSSALNIGRHPAVSAYFNGYLDEFRISKGIARWTSNFTPPSSPYGKVATVTSQKKFGTASGEFHGSGDYLSLADSDDWWFNNQDFTTECWFRTNSGTTRQGILCQRIDDNNLWRLEYDGVTPQLYFDVYSGGIEINLISSGSWQAVVNTWYHCAVVRSGNIYYLFINGNLLATSTNSLAQNNIGSVLYIGFSYRPTGIIDYFNGYLDELRISKGIARWTSNFTPPSAPYETDTTPPTVSSTSPTSSDTGVGVSSAISATFSEDMDSSTITTSTFTLSSSSGSNGTVSYSNKVATFTPSSNLSYSTTYTATITTSVKDLSGNAMSSNYTWSFTTSTATATPTPTPSPGDTTAPTVTITSPTSSATYTTTSSTITLSGTASENSGSVSSVTWSNSKGGSGTASGTTNWTISGISLSSGDNVITVTATDGSGNFGTDTITVTYNVTSTPTPTAVPTATTTPKPSPTAQPTPTRPPTLPPLPTPQPSPSPATNGIVFGFVNDEDEQPLEGVTVTITGTENQGTETDENGYYEFRGLLKGNYNLTYEKDGYQTQSRNISLGDGQQKDMGTITLEEEGELGRIYGYVVDIKGNPIEGVKLALKGLQTKVKARETSDADGYFEFTGLGEDTYIITAKKKRYRNSKITVELEEGEDKEEEIELRRTTKKKVHEADSGMNGDVQK